MVKDIVHIVEYLLEYSIGVLSNFMGVINAETALLYEIKIEPIQDGHLTVPEIDLHEFIGFVFSPGQPPHELAELVEHLDGRPDRLSALYANRQQRLRQADQMLDRYAKLPNAHTYFSYREFMEGRVVE